MQVADGWAARNIRQLDLRESEEMKKDRTYTEGVASNMKSDGVEAEALLASGVLVRGNPRGRSDRAI